VEVETPADTVTSPPVPLLPGPTVTYTEPPRPDDALPEPKYNAPLLPELDVPVLNTNTPLTPDVPAFADDITTAPLDVVPYPDNINTPPPVLDDDSPAVSIMLPP